MVDSSINNNKTNNINIKFIKLTRFKLNIEDEFHIGQMCTCHQAEKAS